MMHTQNTVRLTAPGKRGSPDMITAFKQSFERGPIPGLRTALKVVDDLNFSPEMRGAILFGPQNKPVKAGDFAQIQTIGAERGLKEQEPHIFLSFDDFVLSAGVPIVRYRPTQPQQLHRITLNSDSPSEIALSRFEGGIPRFWSNRFLNGELPILEVNFGRVGVLLTPSNPLVMIAANGLAINISLQLSTAQLA